MVCTYVRTRGGVVWKILAVTILMICYGKNKYAHSLSRNLAALGDGQ